MQSNNPAILMGLIASFKNTAARMIDITGEDVVPINARSIAGSDLAATYIRVL